MTTFQMAQMAYENPGMKFRLVCAIEAGAFVRWDGNVLRWHDNAIVDPAKYQRSNYNWEPVKEPRTWRGEYRLNIYGVRGSGTTPDQVIDGVADVTWEAKEVLP